MAPEEGVSGPDRAARSTVKAHKSALRARPGDQVPVRNLIVALYSEILHQRQQPEEGQDWRTFDALLREAMNMPRSSLRDALDKAVIIGALSLELAASELREDADVVLRDGVTLLGWLG
jgi:hypothetical protein